MADERVMLTYWPLDYLLKVYIDNYPEDSSDEEVIEFFNSFLKDRVGNGISISLVVYCSSDKYLSTRLRLLLSLLKNTYEIDVHSLTFSFKDCQFTKVIDLYNLLTQEFNKTESRLVHFELCTINANLISLLDHVPGSFDLKFACCKFIRINSNFILPVSSKAVEKKDKEYKKIVFDKCIFYSSVNNLRFDSNYCIIYFTNNRFVGEISFTITGHSKKFTIGGNRYTVGSRINIQSTPNSVIDKLFARCKSIIFCFDLHKVICLDLDAPFVSNSKSWLGENIEIDSIYICLQKSNKQTFQSFIEFLIKEVSSLKELHITNIDLIDIPDLSINPNFKDKILTLKCKDFNSFDIEELVRIRFNSDFIRQYRHNTITLKFFKDHQVDLSNLNSILCLFYDCFIEIKVPISGEGIFYNELWIKRESSIISSEPNAYSYMNYYYEEQDIYNHPRKVNKWLGSSNRWNWSDLFDKDLMSKFSSEEKEIFVRTLISKEEKLSFFEDFIDDCYERGYVHLIEEINRDSNPYSLYKLSFSRDYVLHNIRIVRMQCPSTKQFHNILVPLENSVEKAVNWLNKGIDLKSFVSES